MVDVEFIFKNRSSNMVAPWLARASYSVSVCCLNRNKMLAIVIDHVIQERGLMKIVKYFSL